MLCTVIVSLVFYLLLFIIYGEKFKAVWIWKQCAIGSLKYNEFATEKGAKVIPKLNLIGWQKDIRIICHPFRKTEL